MKQVSNYDAQLNVSKYYNNETISNLVSKLSFIGESFYNEKTNTIDIKVKTIASVEHDEMIRQTIRDWLQDLPANKNDIRTLCNNVQYVFNITKIGYPNISEHTISIYLY